MISEARKHPPFQAKHAVEAAAEHWSVACSASPLPGDRDRNFRLHGADRDYVLKFVCVEDSASLTAAVQRVMTAVADAENCPMVPRPVPTTAGDMEARVRGEDGIEYGVVLADWVPGIRFAAYEPRDGAMLRSVGEALAQVDLVLAKLDEPEAERPFDWDLRMAAPVVHRLAHHISDAGRRELVNRCMEAYADQAALFAQIPVQLIHGDANDHNVLLSGTQDAQSRAAEHRPGSRSASRAERRTATGRQIGLIDFGDLTYSWRVADPAIAAAYLATNQDDPVGAMGHLVAGYYAVSPLSEIELEVFPYLVAARLCVSLCHSELRSKTEPGDTYQTISRVPGWNLLERLTRVHPRLITYRLRNACGLEPCPRTPSLRTWLTDSSPVPVLGLPLEGPVFDLSVGTVEFDGGLDPTQASEWETPFSERIRSEGGEIAFGRYLEPRICYQAEQFAATTDTPERQRTIHLGIDLFAPEGTSVSTPYDATVLVVVDNSQPLDYGPTVILEHETPDGPFWTLFGHLGPGVLTHLAVGDILKAGHAFAELGSSAENGGWPPHLHLQIFADVFDTKGNLPGVAFPSQAETWRSVSPDPELILRSGKPTTFQGPTKEQLRVARASRLGKNLSLSYQDPLHIVRGIGVHLFDEAGRAYLDCVNNVCHLGHAHPAVVKAAAGQLSVLNTNTRYLHPNIVAYGDALTANLPEGLDVCFLVNSGSEANDLAIRLARAATGREGMIVVESGYHGNLSSLVDLSSYKFSGPGGEGPPAHVEVVRIPDPYRNSGIEGAEFAADIQRAAAALNRRSRPPAAFLAESILGCGGQIVPPPGYLIAAYAHARAAGALCIADEVQTGFGRVGRHMWAFQLQNVVPDIVTLGKPMGNGFPMGGVITTRAIADAFAGGMEYFNTYGGNPVSSAVGTAVLATIEKEHLQARALRVGEYLKARLARLAEGYPILGDVRGEGLFLGLEMVVDPDSREPAASAAAHLVERMKDLGVLLSADGPRHNVIKIKPPMVFSQADADELIRKLTRVLGETYFAEPAPI